MHILVAEDGKKWRPANTTWWRSSKHSSASFISHFAFSILGQGEVYVVSHLSPTLYIINAKLLPSMELVTWSQPTDMAA